MKTSTVRIVVIVAGLALCAKLPAQPQPNSSETNVVPAEVVGELIQSVIEAQQGVNGTPPEDNNAKGQEAGSGRIRGEGTRGSPSVSTNAQPLASLVTNAPAAKNGKNLRLNFRNAPLSLVLDYLSEAAGFTISANSKVDLRGSVTVWSNQPVDRNEAIQILSTALTGSGYAADVEGTLLHIYVVDASNSPIIAGVPGNEYTNVPPTKELVTQVVYIKNVEAQQLISALQPLMPTGTSLSSFQGANALVLTDTKSNIRRMLQLVKAFDTPTVSASMVRVFPLQYADATQLAQVVQQLFNPDATANNGQQGGGRRFGGFFGGGGPFGGGGNAGGNTGSTPPTGRVAAPKVTAVADDRSNSLVVSAAEDQMQLIANVVDQMDVSVNDVTEVRVFRLRHADPQETADQLANLFPDSSNAQNNRGQQFQFGPFRGFGGNQASAGSANQSQRRLNQTRVTAVADPRTSSVLVSAGRDLMQQIAGIIEDLDSDPAKKKKVYVIKVENRDPQQVVQDLQSVIASDNTANLSASQSGSGRQPGSQLTTRGQNNLQSQGSSSGFNLNNSSGSRSTTGR
jgi:general secretion pathway protein D